MSNFEVSMAPRPVGDGSYAVTNVVKPETPLPCIDSADDTGKYVGAILASPIEYEGKVLSSSTDVWTFAEIVAAMSKASGETVAYKQMPVDIWASFIPAARRDNIVGMFQFIEEYGYYGPETKEKVAWTAQQARGKLTTLDEYLEKRPLNFH